MPVNGRHEQTPKVLETLAKCGGNPNVDGGENIALSLPVRSAASLTVSLPKK